MKKLSLPSFLLLLAAVPSFAQTPCPGRGADVTGKLTSPAEYTISWQPVAGALFYDVEEQRAGIAPLTNVTRRFGVGTGSSLKITHESINDVPYVYRVRAFGKDFQCDMFATARTQGDPRLRQAVRRGIIPVAGSARGANGSQFKTSLRLEGPSLRGRIVFHAANRVASDDDPSIPYDTAMRSEWDDIVAAIGQTGIGSLSIIPSESDQGLLPRATVRLYNVASNGVLGANVDMYPAVDYLDVNEPFQVIEVPADGNFRVNVGARAILEGSARAIAVGADGVQKRVVERKIEAGEVLFGSPEAIYGLPIGPGESLIVVFTRAIVPFYTLTDNRTNDPFLYVQGADRDTLVDQYIK